MRKQVLLIVVLAALPAIADAQLYKCSDTDGHTVYGDRPCPGGMKSQPLKPDKVPVVTPGDSTNTDRTAQSTTDGNNTNRIRQFDQQIAELESKRDKLTEMLRYEQNIVRSGKPDIPVNPEGTGWEQTTNDELHVVYSRYNADIDAIDEKLRDLRAQRRQLLKPR